MVSKLNHKIQTILFDLDDTLIDSERIYAQLYKNLKLDLSILQKARSEVKEGLGAGHVAARNRLLYFKRYLELKQEFSALSLINLSDAYETQLQELVEADLVKSGNQTVLENLAAQFQLGIVTNENLRTQMLKINKIDPKHKIFSFILTSEEVGVEKPHPIIIDRVITLSKQSTDSILMIGDSVTNDLAPFLERGCSILGTRQFRDESLTQEGKSFKWIDRLKDLLS